MAGTLGSILSFDGPGPVNQVGSYPFLGAPQAPPIAAPKGGFVSQHPGMAPNEGVTSAQVEPLITYKAMIAIDASSHDQNFIKSEPLFATRPERPNAFEITKVFTLSCLNYHLNRQHERLAEPYNQKRGREDPTPLSPDQVITEDNFSDHLVFLGFVADTSNAPTVNCGPNNPAPKTLVISIQSKGKMDCAYLWGGGKERVAAEVGDHVGFVVKRLNSVQKPCDNLIKDRDAGSDQVWRQLLDNIGPLQVLPIAARRHYCWNTKTICDAENLQSLMMKYSHGHQYMEYSRNKTGTTEYYSDRYTYRDVAKRTNEFPSNPADFTESKDAPLRHSATDLEKEKWTGPPVSTRAVLFDDLVDEHVIDAYSRGTNYVSVNNLSEMWCTNQSYTISPVVRVGLVICAGYIQEVFSAPPARHMIAQACTTRNGGVPMTKPFRSRKEGDIRNGDNINFPFGVLQDSYGLHMFVHLPPPPFTLTEEDRKRL